MKKCVIIFIVSVVSICLHAQNNTIFGRNSEYLYPQWYDQCDFYINDPGLSIGAAPVYFSVDYLAYSSDFLLLSHEEVSVPHVVDGIAVMISTDSPLNQPRNPVRAPEWVLLCLADSSGMPIDTIASVRWDTITPRTMILPQNLQAQITHNSTNAMVVSVYEARFEHPVVVEGEVVIVATNNSNVMIENVYDYWPSFYAYITDYNADFCGNCFPSPITAVNLSSGVEHSSFPRHFSPFLFILDTDSIILTVVSADSLMGTVNGSGEYRTGEPVVVTATPSPFCHFTSWSDGVTDNPRVMYLYQDSTVTAFFVNDSSNYVRVLVNNPEWGTTDGTGIYPYGQDAVISATAYDGYVFTEWADGNDDNPRNVVLLSDTVITAIFDPIPAGIDTGLPLEFSITPNPAHGIFTINCEYGNHIIHLYDAAGRQTFTQSFSGDSFTIDVEYLPSGVYTAVLYTGARKGTKKIVKL